MAGDRVPIDAQSIAAPLSRFAVFLVVTVARFDGATGRVFEVISGVGDLIKTVAFHDLNARFSCVVGIGAELWATLPRNSSPKELHPFIPITGARHTAPATPGDLLFHIRSDRSDLCFEFERLLLDALGDAVNVADETQGFRYFDTRDLLGFVDGTANPIGAELPEASVIGGEDPEFAGGSYVVVQKYVHDINAWVKQGTADQEAVIGRTKFDNVELPDANGPQLSHKTLTTITDDDGVEQDILRDNMPFGSPGNKEFGTYFIGYSRRLWVIERMLERMFIGEPPGHHDRILDVSTAITGCTFFVPSSTMLHSLAAPKPPAPAPHTKARDRTDSLGIGSLRRTPIEGESP